MAVIGALLTGVGVVTSFNESFVPQSILIGTTDTDLPLSKLEVTVGGTSTINITGQADVQAFAKLFGKPLLGADVKVSQEIVIGNGFSSKQKSFVRLTNAGATTPNVMYHSRRKAEQSFVPMLAGQDTINALSSRPFSGFSALIFDESNLDYADIEFADGHQDKFSAPELHAMLATQMACDADGKLAGRTVILNQGDMLRVTLYTTNGGTLTYTIVQ